MALFSFLSRIPPSTRGAVLLTVGISIFGFTDNFTMLVSDDVGVGQFHASRSFFSVFMVLALSRVFGLSVVPKNWGPVMARTVFIVMSMFLYFSVIPMMPIAEAGAGLFTSPIFVLIFSALIFKEKIGVRRIAAVMIGSVGVLMVLQPAGDDFTIFHILPVLAGAFYAIGSIITYRYCQDESPLAILMMFLITIGLTGALYTSIITAVPASEQWLEQAPFLLMAWQAIDLTFVGWMVMIAAGASIALSLMTRAYQLTQTSYAVIFEYAYLISAGFFSWLFWGVVPNLLSILGIIFIALAGIVIVWAQISATNQPQAEH